MDRKKIEHFMDCIRGLVFDGSPELHSETASLLEELAGEEKAKAFMDGMPEIRRLVLSDVEAIANNDPAASDRDEIISCYPGVTAMLHYRTANRMFRLGIPILPRFITELAHSATGIDIHPAASIGEYFAIDHGTGIVIGATAVIGHHVMLYQGVTLGARNFTHDGLLQHLHPGKRPHRARHHNRRQRLAHARRPAPFQDTAGPCNLCPFLRERGRNLGT